MLKQREGKLARWIGYMDSFIYEIEYREVLQYPHTYAMSGAPSGIGFKWCKGWKKVEHVFSVAGRA